MSPGQLQNKLGVGRPWNSVCAWAGTASDLEAKIGKRGQPGWMLLGGQERWGLRTDPCTEQGRGHRNPGHFQVISEVWTWGLLVPSPPNTPSESVIDNLIYNLQAHAPGYHTLLQARWSSTLSIERAISFTFLLANSGASFAARPSSVVHTGVKSRGWEKRMPHLKRRKPRSRLNEEVIANIV